MFKILFAVAFIGPQGPAFGSVEEDKTFKTHDECMAFGALMTPRVADWVRGRIELEWDVPVSVHFACEPNGNPA